MPLSFPGDSTLLPSQVFVSSLRTETRRSCLGGLRGAAGSETSRYDFCHDQKAKSHVTKWHPSSTGYHPPPFWRKSHPVGLLVLVCFGSNGLTWQIQPTDSTDPQSHSACSTLSGWLAWPNPWCLALDLIVSASSIKRIVRPVEAGWASSSPAARPPRCLHHQLRAGVWHRAFLLFSTRPQRLPTRIDLDYLRIRSPVAIRKGASSSA